MWQWFINLPFWSTSTLKILWKYSEGLKQKKLPFTKFQAIRLQFIILDISKRFESKLWELRVWERQMNWIWCQNINYPLYQREVISLLSFSMTLRQGCRNVTMGPWIIHILRSSQSWCNIGATRNIDLEKTLLILTLPLQHCIDVAIKIFMICCEIKLLSNAEATLISNCEFYAVVLMFWRIC